MQSAAEQSAPLDPKNVKPGDTVTVEIAPPGIGPGRKPYSITGEVYESTWEPGALVVGDFILGHRRVTLTAHTPAPEPEPDPGTFGTAVSSNGRVRGFFDDAGDFHYPDARGVAYTASSVTDFRPLVVIDRAEVDVEALAQHNGLRTEPLRGVLRDLGIEVPR